MILGGKPRDMARRCHPLLRSRTAERKSDTYPVRELADGQGQENATNRLIFPRVPDRMLSWNIYQEIESDGFFQNPQK